MRYSEGATRTNGSENEDTDTRESDDEQDGKGDPRKGEPKRQGGGNKEANVSMGVRWLQRPQRWGGMARSDVPTRLASYPLVVTGDERQRTRWAIEVRSSASPVGITYERKR